MSKLRNFRRRAANKGNYPDAESILTSSSALVEALTKRDSTPSKAPQRESAEGLQSLSAGPRPEHCSGPNGI
jgi:hypothetical protein